MSGTNFGIFRPNALQGVNISAEERVQKQQLGDFIRQLEDYVPTVPDAVTAHYLHTAGFDTNDPRIVRFISVVVQKYVSDVANDAMQHCKVRTAKKHEAATKAGQSVKERKCTLRYEDLQPALADHGITTRKPNYFT